ALPVGGVPAVVEEGLDHAAGAGALAIGLGEELEVVGVGLDLVCRLLLEKKKCKSSAGLGVRREWYGQPDVRVSGTRITHTLSCRGDVPVGIVRQSHHCR